MKKYLYGRLLIFVLIYQLPQFQTSFIPKRQDDGGVDLEGNNPKSNTIDVDAGNKRRITEVNKDNFLHGNDILEETARNGLIDENTRWSKNIPVHFSDQLSLLAIATIMEGIEDLELKTCFKFVNQSVETDYISIAPLEGCFSFVGRRGGAQTLSIGSGCELIDIVQHEILHALGLFHEQSRPDRDDYVTVQLENVGEDNHHNFLRYEVSFVDHQRVPYDYYSIMHYTQNAFSANGSPAIVTLNPAFQSVIGTGQAMSSGDLTKIQRMYDFGDIQRYSYFCDFEDNSICGYVAENTGWIRHSVSVSLPDLLQTDATFGQIDTGNVLVATSSNPSPTFLKVRTPLLQSTVSTQCLEFSYYMHSTNTEIALSVTLESTTSSNLGEIFTLNGDQGQMWRKARVTMSAPSEFKLLFTATAGSADVVAIDDVNVIDRSCETGFFTLEGFSDKLDTSSRGDVFQSPLMYTNDGYAFVLTIYPFGDSLSSDSTYMSVFFHIARGVNDDQLEWPFQNRYIKLSLVDQTADVLQQSNVIANFLTDTNSEPWGQPTTEFNRGWGYRSFVTVDNVRTMKSYIKHDSIIISIQVTDMTNWSYLQAAQTTTPRATTTTTTTVSTTTSGATTKDTTGLRLWKCWWTVMFLPLVYFIE